MINLNLLYNTLYREKISPKFSLKSFNVVIVPSQYFDSKIVQEKYSFFLTVSYFLVLR